MTLCYQNLCIFTFSVMEEKNRNIARERVGTEEMSGGDELNMSGWRICSDVSFLRCTGYKDE